MSARVDDEDDITEAPLWRRPAVLVIAAAVAGVIAFAFLKPTAEKRDPETAKPAQAFIGDVVPYKPAIPDPAPTPPTKAAEAPPPAAQPVIAPLPAPPSFRPAAAMAKPAAPARPAMLSYAAPPPAAPTPPVTAPEAPQTRVAFKGGDIPGAKASAAIDTTYVLMPGLLPIVLDTAISSDVPSGSILGHLPGPVYSPRGVLLMEAGTQIIGKYDGLKNGGNRLQAISTYAITPNGVFIPLTDNMSDDLGRTGLDGDVNHRYIERFGAAISLDLSQSVLGVIQAEASKGGNTYLSLGQGGSSGLAEQILQSTINLPPIFSKPQGSTIALFLSTPIDFSDSYKIRSR